MRTSSKVMLAVALVMGLAGCTSTHNENSGAPSSPSISGVAMSDAQKQALSDGVVTQDEYLAAFRRYSACMDKAGYKILPGETDNEVLSFGIPDAAVKSGVDGKCEQREFFEIDTKWQLSRADTSDQAKAYAVCLQEAGITPARTETEKYNQLQKAHLDPTQCYLKQYGN